MSNFSHKAKKIRLKSWRSINEKKIEIAWMFHANLVKEHLWTIGLDNANHAMFQLLNAY